MADTMPANEIEAAFTKVWKEINKPSPSVVFWDQEQQKICEAMIDEERRRRVICTPAGLKSLFPWIKL